jgi:SAM-dependent methyltransferase
MRDQSRLYTPEFYRELAPGRDSARELLPIILDLLQPHSMADIGCGCGDWLAVASELGVKDLLGVDGAWVQTSQLAIPQDRFVVHDLATPLKLERRFDVVVCLEVAEHLPSSAALGFIAGLCEASDKVVFSAAIPGQGGRHHVNEQWPEYWADIFGRFGYGCYDVIRSRIWNNPEIAWYYSQNCLIFARPELVPHLGAAQPPLSLVHPALWSAQVSRLNSPGKLLERLPKAILSRLSRKPL